jgi:hypothetical protein
MNIKLKAALITIALVFGLFATVYAIAYYPITLFFMVLGVLIFLVYKSVLYDLKRNERSKK